MSIPPRPIPDKREHAARRSRLSPVLFAAVLIIVVAAVVAVLL
jgi:hypothetical protein